MLLINFLPNKLLPPSNFDLCITCGQRDQIVCIQVILIILYVYTGSKAARSHAGEVRDSLGEERLYQGGPDETSLWGPVVSLSF